MIMTTKQVSQGERTYRIYLMLDEHLFGTDAINQTIMEQDNTYPITHGIAYTDTANGPALMAAGNRVVSARFPSPGPPVTPKDIEAIRHELQAQLPFQIAFGP